MKTFISTHNKAFRAEWLKLRHSGMIWLLIGATAFIPVIITLVGFFVNSSGNENDAWNGFIKANFQGFTGFFYPLFVVIMALRIVYLEHRSDTWKLMETQPVSRAALFLSKWEVAALISLISLFGLLLFALTGGLLLQLFRKDSGFSNSSVDWGLAAKVIFRYWIGSLAIISVQYFFSLLIKNFAWPMSIGLVAIIAGSTLVQFGVMTWWPYATAILTTASYEGSVAGKFLLSHEKLSLAWTVLFLWLGYQLFVRKSFARAYIKPAKTLVITLIAIIAFIAIAWWVNKPSVLSRYSNTVLAGEVSSKKPVSNVVLLQAPLMDTVISIPVQNKKFHALIEKEIPTGIYYLRAGQMTLPVYFGYKDSMYVAVDIDGNTNDPKISGTRMAENQFLLSGLQKSNDWSLTSYAYQFKPAEYAQQVMAAWKEKQDKIDKFKTTDRIKPSNDFISAMKKLNSMNYASLLNSYYPRIHSVYYPNEELKYPKFTDQLLKETHEKDESLISFSEYRNYVLESIKQKSGRSDSAYFATLNSSLQTGNAHDLILYEGAQTNLFRIRDSNRRALLLQQILASINNEKVKARLIENNDRLNRMRRGQKAQNFFAEALNGNKFALRALANRYIVLDVWATWCAPCKREAPYFEQLAEQYTSEQVAFVSVSIDDDKNAWISEASGKKNTRILQLWATDADADFAKGLAVNSIPRFILIDPRGNIINSELPPPSDPEFETILQKEIPILRSSNSF
ncbi:MAG: ABC transporter permease [Chitinophagaceae bacterium]